MLRSLRARLVLMTLVVALIAVACVGILSRRSTLIEFHAFVNDNQTSSLEEFRGLLEEQYQQRGSWDNSQKLLDRISRMTDKQIILADSQRKVLATSPPELMRANIRIRPTDDLTISLEERRDGPLVSGQEMEFHNAPHAVLHDPHNVVVGILYSVRKPAAPSTQQENTFAGALNKTLLLAALAAAAVALLVAVILSHRIVRPVEALTSAARRIAGGDLGQRVNASSRDEIGELGRAFNSMADNLARAEELRRNMTNDVAHELRTPLTNIRCQIEALQDGLSSPSPEVIDSLHDEAMLLQHLIDDLQDLSLAEAGRLSLELGPVSVSEEVLVAVNAVQLRMGGGGPSIKIELPDNCPEVSADSQRLGQVLRNLLNNAVAHTPPEGAITIRASRIDSKVEFMVADTGSGIALADLPYVFDRFYRADSSRDRATGGAGLGLAIVKQIVIAHGGSIRIESQPSQGTKTFFTIPAA